MMSLRSLSVSAAFLGLATTGCTMVSDARSPTALREGAESHTTMMIAMSPANACPRIARMLSWCATGPNYHYRCLIAPDDETAELTGNFEPVFRTEVFLVVDFVRVGSSSSQATIHQNQGMLTRDYGAMIEKFLTRPDCQPG